MTSTASAPPTPMATMPRPPAFGVWLSVPIIIPPGKAYCSSTTWWMMPEPGLPEADAVAGRDRLEEVVDLGVVLARRRSRSTLPSTLAWMRWSQCTVEGTATSVEPGGHELQQRHLGGGVLHGDAVGAQVVVGHAALEVRRSGSSRWSIRIFSARVSGRPSRGAGDVDAGVEPGVDVAGRARWGWMRCAAMAVSSGCRSRWDELGQGSAVWRSARTQRIQVYYKCVRTIRYQVIADDLRRRIRDGRVRPSGGPAASRVATLVALRRQPGHRPPGAGGPAHRGPGRLPPGLRLVGRRRPAAPGAAPPRHHRGPAVRRRASARSAASCRSASCRHRPGCASCSGSGRCSR